MGWGAAPSGSVPLLAWVPAWTPDRLGDAEFRRTFGVSVPYCAGAMANGIASTALVVAMARAGFLGFFGSAGLPVSRVTSAIDTVQAAATRLPVGFDLIHSPQDPRAEQENVDLYLNKGISIIGASAFVGLTAPLVQYRLTGIRRLADGRVVAPNRVFAKVSRAEVADRFLRTPPERLVRALVEAGRIRPEEAALAGSISMADALVAEADSGGHTDRRPLSVLLPLLAAHRAKVAAETGLSGATLIGAAGGLGTPSAVAAAFALGAAFVVTGSVNQATIEADTSPMVRAMLGEADMADTCMAPASDMFEQGAQVQVLQRGTMYGPRAAQLRELWKSYASWSEIPLAERRRVEGGVLRRSFDEVWADCAAFFAERDPGQVERAAREPRHQMALVFRWYLGLSSKWAISGDESRRADVQVWCGPAMGAFNAWAAGSHLADPLARSAVDIAANLMAGAAAISRAHVLRAQGVEPGPEAFDWRPRPLHRRGAF